MSEGMTIKDIGSKNCLHLEENNNGTRSTAAIVGSTFFNNRWNGLDQQLVGAIASN